MRLDRAGRARPSSIALLLLNLAGLSPRYFLDAVTSPPSPPPPPPPPPPPAPPCRCAVLYSGHVRSFSQPHVHLSHKEHLVEQLRSDCDVDVFMYLSVEDEIPMRYRMGKFADELSFTPYSPQQSAVDHAVQALDPIAVQFHQDQAGFIQNWCGAGCKNNAFWQLYKMRAVYRMMEKHEASTGLPYTWVIRSRLDIGWMQPMPPLSRFPPTRVYAGHNFFPLADQLLLIPRQFAYAVFTAVNLCYNCGVLEVQAKSGIPAQTESFLRLALQRAGVPLGYYEFPIVIVRNNEGGVCGVLHPHKLTCQMLQWAGLIGLQVPADGGHDEQATTVPCTDTVNRWHRRACLEMFPPTYDKDALYTSLQQRHDVEFDTPAASDTLVASDTPVGSDTPAGSDTAVGSDTHVAGRSSSRGGGGGGGGGSGRGGQKENGGENDLQGVGGGDVGFNAADSVDKDNIVDGQFGEGPGQDELSGRTYGGSSGHDETASASVTAMVSFKEATGRLEGVRGSLRELRGAIRTYAAPRKPRSTHFFAHHYPFHQTDGGPRDEIAIIEGFRISETDFNRIAHGLACLLSDVEHKQSDPEEEVCAATACGLGDCDICPSKAARHRGNSDGGSSNDDSPDGEGGPASIHGDSARNVLMLRTIGAGDGDLDAVNCSAVESLRDVWISLLDHDFDPPESICRGSIKPCLDRAMKSFVV